MFTLSFRAEAIIKVQIFYFGDDFLFDKWDGFNLGLRFGFNCRLWLNGGFGSLNRLRFTLGLNFRLGLFFGAFISLSG